MTIVIRRLSSDDDIEALTELLHRAYAPLAAAGMRYLATHQDAQTTRERAAQGECWVAEREGQVVGTITLIPPQTSHPGVAWYDRPDVAVFGQFAVEPALQGEGIGAMLMTRVEQRAKALGAAELALDTAESASALIATYTRRGYRHVDMADWRPVTNYRSVILSRSL